MDEEEKKAFYDLMQQLCDAQDELTRTHILHPENVKTAKEDVQAAADTIYYFADSLIREAKK